MLATVQTVGKGFSSTYGEFRAGLERAAEGEWCLQHCKVSAAPGHCCLWANTSDQDMGAGSAAGSTTREVSATNLISAMQIKVRETPQDGCFLLLIFFFFLIEKS